MAAGALHTAEEALRLDPGGLWELVEGRVVRVSPAGARHGRTVARVSRALSDFVEPRGLGFVLTGDVGFVIRRGPDTVRAPDVAFVRGERFPGGLPAEFIAGAPDLAVEVLSPTDRWAAVAGKAREFIAGGSLAVWAIDPVDEQARVYTVAGERVLAVGEAFEAPDLLPDFTLRTSDLW
jgi:Uma2 family endonuclease